MAFRHGIHQFSMKNYKFSQNDWFSFGVIFSPEMTMIGHKTEMNPSEKSVTTIQYFPLIDYTV